MDSARQKFRTRLNDITKKKFTTTMIHSISQFENNFGHLWGHGKELADLTVDELDMRRKWEVIRKSILDTGHQQMRNLLTEYGLYDIVFRGYQYNFTPVQKKEKAHESAGIRS